MSEIYLRDTYVVLRGILPRVAAGAVIKALREINRNAYIQSKEHSIEHQVVLGSIGWGEAVWFGLRSHFSMSSRMSLIMPVNMPISLPTYRDTYHTQKRNTPRKLRPEDLNQIPRGKSRRDWRYKR